MPAAIPDAAVPDRTAEIAERDYLLRALALLPPGQRAVLVLRYFDDLSEGETAEMLGCSVGTVKSQAARALETLRGAADQTASDRPIVRRVGRRRQKNASEVGADV